MNSLSAFVLRIEEWCSREILLSATTRETSIDLSALTITIPGFSAIMCMEGMDTRSRATLQPKYLRIYNFRVVEPVFHSSAALHQNPVLLSLAILCRWRFLIEIKVCRRNVFTWFFLSKISASKYPAFFKLLMVLRGRYWVMPTP